MRLSNFAMATVRQSTVARHNGCLAGADMRIALHLRNTSLIKRILVTGNFYLPKSFSCHWFPTCFTSLAWRRPWNVRGLMLSTCKKKKEGGGFGNGV